MIAKLERTPRTAQQNKDQTQSPHKQSEQQQTMNQERKNHRLKTDSSKSTGDVVWIKLILLPKSLSSILQLSYTKCFQLVQASYN